MRIVMFVEGDPAGQPRVQFSRRSGRPYTPQTRKRSDGSRVPLASSTFRAAVMEAILIQASKMDGPIEGPVEVSWTAMFERPCSHFRANKRDRGLRETAPTPSQMNVKPDRDNIDKLVLDCLVKGRLLRDDKQVCCGTLVKRWADAGSPAGIHIQIEAL